MEGEEWKGWKVMKRKCNSIEGWGSVAVGEREWRKVNIVIDAVVNCERWIYIYI